MCASSEEWICRERAFARRWWLYDGEQARQALSMDSSCAPLPCLRQGTTSRHATAWPRAQVHRYGDGNTRADRTEAWFGYAATDVSRESWLSHGSVTYQGKRSPRTRRANARKFGKLVMSERVIGAASVGEESAACRALRAPLLLCDNHPRIIDLAGGPLTLPCGYCA